MTPEEFEHMKEYMTQPVLHYEDEVFLTYFGDACTICGMLDLPEDGKYRIDVIDVWEMDKKDGYGRSRRPGTGAASGENRGWRCWL